MILSKKLFPLLMLLMTSLTIACTNTPEEKKKPEQKKEIITMAFPKHPGTIKMITMLDNSVKIKPISDIPERHQFIYYDSNDSKVDKENAVRGTPIVEVRMHSLIGDKLVPTKEANLLYTEMYDAKGNIIHINKMWRKGTNAGKAKQKSK